MDQIYLPKNRAGLPTGEYVIIRPLQESPQEELKPFFYNVEDLEPIKVEIIKKIFNKLNELEPENLIVGGSFLDKGFRFNDIDILLINDRLQSNVKDRVEYLQMSLGIKIHLIQISNKELMKCLSSDPLYNMMLSKFISLKRVIFHVRREINYKILDLQLLKSKTLIDNYEILNGEEKYYLSLNMISILLFLNDKKLSKDIVNKEIEKIFKIKIKEIKDNMIDKDFLKKFKEVYNFTFNKILNGIK